MDISPGRLAAHLRGGVAGLLTVAALTPTSSAGEQKISASIGNLTGPLTAQDRFGHGLAPLGDLDGDGFLDVAVGTRDDDTGTDRGALYVLFLRDDGTVRSEVRIAQGSGGLTASLPNGCFFGASVANIGDLDGDGVTDLLVGAPDDSADLPEAGAAWVLFMKADGTVKAEQKLSASQGHLFPGEELPLDDFFHFGAAITPLGDLDGDGGTLEVAVGAPGEQGGGSARGMVYVLSLRPDGLLAWHSRFGPETGGFGGLIDDDDRLGAALACPGDLDGDGVVDLAVGAPGDDDGGPERGAVWLVHLKGNGSVASQHKLSDFDFPLQQDFEEVGSALAAVGDLNGDGTTDLVAGAPIRAGGAGGFYHLFLDAQGFLTSWRVIDPFTGPYAIDWSLGGLAGNALALLGDVDGDGQDDLAMGQHHDNDGATAAGATWVLFQDAATFADTTPYADEGGGLAGSLEPDLGGTGQLVGGDQGSLVLTGAPEGGVAHLVVGFSELGASFKGGTLVPTPDLLFTGIPVDADGHVVLPFTWPTGIPQGTSTWNQFWVPDGAAPAGFAASNGLKATQL